MGDKTSIRDVFDQSQDGLQGHGKLIKKLQKVYGKTEFDEFWERFKHYMKYAMVVFKREPAVERVIDFVAKFASSVGKKLPEKGEGASEEEDEEEEDSVADNRLLQEMFDFLLDVHSARDRAVRFRCCQLINKLLTNLGEDAQIDDELYDRLYECMLERLKDKCPLVRYHAVLAMSRLQDPTDENCPVIKAYLFLLNCDPNPDVRRAVLTSIAPSTKTLASIVGRTRDVKDTVRRAAYEVLSEKVHIKALSIATRLQILNEGLKDRSEIVKQACSGKLLQAWLRTFNGSMLDILKSLDVEDSTDVCSKVLETLFKGATTQDIIERFNILNDSLLIPDEELTSEGALYWQAVCKYFHEMGQEGYENLERVMPAVVDFCSFMQRYVDELKKVEDPEIQLGREFIIEQLLLITALMDTADTASRKALETLLHNMLMADHISHRLVKPVVSRICELRGTSENMVPYYAEMVSEIREPITVIEKDIEEEQKRQINLKVASIRVQLNQLREDLDEAVKGQDFTKAAELKSTIAQLDAEKKTLLETTEPTREEVRTERNDPVTILKCQTIISEMLQLLKLKTVSPTLQMMIESQIVPGIQNADAEVRNMAMQALGLVCYLSKELMVTYIPLFMQASQIDLEDVRVTALQVLFDFLLIYGLEIVDASESSSTESTDTGTGTADGNGTENGDTRSGTASKLVAIICSFLDVECYELRACAAEGLSKLLLSGRVVSSKILSHLILLWYNPLSEDETHLRDCLGTFFPLFGLASRGNQEVVEEAFLPTLRTLLNAPATSPLAEVDVNNVAELLVQLTNTKLLTMNQNQADISQDNPGHDNLSETVCNEILSAPDSPHVKLWVRILNQMEVSPDNEVVLKDLRILCYKMVKTVKERACLRSLEKFQVMITRLASKFVSNDDDLENIEIEPPTVTAILPTTESLNDTEEVSQTPKRKRVRGLYSQNLTLDLEGELELDITDDIDVDVDSSCLMSRQTSVSSDTPSKRGRKNTVTTEIADDGVFAIPEVPEPTKTPARKESSDEDKTRKVSDDMVETESETEDIEQSEGSSGSTVKSPHLDKAEKETSQTEGCKTKSAKSPETKKTKSPETKLAKSPETKKAKTPETKKAPKSPEKLKKGGVSPKVRSPKKTKEGGKPDAGKSPRSRSPNKKGSAEKPSENSLTTKSKQRPTSSDSAKSPREGAATKRGRSTDKAAGSVRKTAAKSQERKSPEKRKTSKSPVSVSTEKRRSTSASPSKKAEKRKASKSPLRDRKRISKSPVRKAAEKKPASKSPEKRKLPKSSPIKETVANRKSQQKSPAEDPSPSKSPAKKMAKKVVEDDKGKTKNVDAEKSKQPERKKSASDKASEKVKGLASSKTSGKTVRTAATKSVDSPRTLRAKAAKVAITKQDKSVAEAAKSGSPRIGTRNVGKSVPVVKTPELGKRRASTRSVPDTPETKSPRRNRLATEESVAETPEHLIGKPASTRNSAKQTTVSTKPGRIHNTPQSTPEGATGRRASKRNVTSSIGSQSDSSPEKGVTRRAVGTRTKLGSSLSSVSSSPDSAKPSKPKTGISKGAEPVKKIASKPSSQTEDDEEDTIRRKARPSRPSVRASTSLVATPPTSARSTRSSLSQSSLMSSPAQSSPRQTRKPGVKVAEKSSRTASRGKNPSATRNTREGVGDVGSPASTISLLSTVSGKSTASSKLSSPRGATSRSTVSESSTPPRSRSSSRSAVTTKVTRSAVPLKPGNTRDSKLRRPMRSTLQSK